MKAIIATMTLALVALSGCFGDEGTGSASIYVKDAATDEFDEIHVVFHDVRVHAAGNGSENSTTGWIVIYENATGFDVDLLNLSGAKAAFLGEAELEAGKYTQIRINVSEAYGVKDGNRTEISLANHKVKVVKSFDIEADKETRIVLDFDLDKSVRQNGPHGWKMTPVIGKTFVEVVESSESGADVHEEGEVTEIEGAA